MYKAPLKIVEDNGYIITDTTDGGYVNRATYHDIQDWKTVWSKDLKLQEIWLNKENVTHILMKKDDYDFHKITRAKGRHLRALKEMLGVVEPKKANKKQVFYLNQGIHFVNTPIRVEEVIIYPDTLGIRDMRVKKFQAYWSLITPEKKQKVDEYNQKLKEFLDYQKRIFEEIFDGSDSEE